MFKNLIAEIARNDVKRSDLSDLLEMSYNNLNLKLHGRVKISLDEAVLIRDTFFPTMTLDYLFDSDRGIKEERK